MQTGTESGRERQTDTQITRGKRKREAEVPRESHGRGNRPVGEGKDRGNMQTPGDGDEERHSHPETAEHTEPVSRLRRAFRASQAYGLYSDSKLCDQVLSTGRRAGPASEALKLSLANVRAATRRGRHSRSLPWMIWKFFTEACVTRPWKLST